MHITGTVREKNIVVLVYGRVRLNVCMYKKLIKKVLKIIAKMQKRALPIAHCWNGLCPPLQECPIGSACFCVLPMITRKS